MSVCLLQWRPRAPRIPILVVLVFLPVLGVRAADAPLDLHEAVARAARNAPSLMADADRVQAAQDDLVRAGRLPDPELQVGMQNLTVTGPEAFVPGADSMTMQTIGVMQQLPSRASRDAERAAAAANLTAANAGHAATAQDVRQAAAEAWVALWAAQRKLELLNELKGEADTAVLASKARLAGGKGNASEALASRAERTELDNQLAAAQASVAAAGAALARWLGSDEERNLAPPPDFSELPLTPATLLARIDQQAPMLDWTAREAKANAAVDAARANKHPDWSVGVSYGRRFGGRDDMISLNFGIRLPIFSGNRQDRDISARYAERDAVHAAHEDARRAQRAAVQGLLAEWQSLTTQVHRDRDELLPLAHDRSRVALAAYRGGASLQPWLEARRAEIRIRLDYAGVLSAWGRDWAALAYLIPKETTP
ncbi:MAG TPA: TolC family protein [Rhodanobacteraceae bacterium]|nr:TolC family protein [Rhodanobacteraceae bacterium]